MSRNSRPSSHRGNEKQKRYAKKKRLRRYRTLKENQKAAGKTVKRKMCSSKVRYKSSVAAMAKATAITNDGYGPLRVYKCPLCGYWHLTHKVADTTSSGSST